MVTRRLRPLPCVSSIAAVLLMIVSDFRTCAEPIGERIDLEKWEAPRTLKEAFPYYVSGLDNKGQPVFVIEYGRWNVRKYFEDGGDSKILYIYLNQIIFTISRWSKTIMNLPTSENSTSTGLFGLVGDFEGYDSKQLTHLPSLAFATNFSKKLVAGPLSKMAYANLIKMSPVAKVLAPHFLFPIIGDTFSKKVKLSGNDEKEWVSLLLEKIPKNSLPSWYGGSPSFEPLAVFG